MNFRMYGIVVDQFCRTVIVIFDYLTLKRTLPSKRNQPTNQRGDATVYVYFFKLKNTNLSLQ